MTECLCDCAVCVCVCDCVVGGGDLCNNFHWHEREYNRLKDLVEGAKVRVCVCGVDVSVFTMVTKKTLGERRSLCKIGGLRECRYLSSKRENIKPKIRIGIKK